MNQAHYDDPSYSYVEYWQGRDYEHLCETIAIKRLLGKRHFQHGVDVGGGYGRLTTLLAQYCDAADLVEPSQKQRGIGKEYLSTTPGSRVLEGTAEQTNLPDEIADLVMMIRVMHHLPSPEAALQELNRILRPGGYLLLECANSLHFKSRLKSLIKGEKIPLTPIERRQDKNQNEETIPFVNHHPETIKKQLAACGFQMEEILSVSNLRLPGLKRILSPKLMASVEKPLQKTLSSLYFGPSILFFARKEK